MRLGFHYHIPFHVIGGKISTPGYLGRFLDSIAAEVDHLTCFMHSAADSDVQYSDYILQATNVCWVDLGPKTSVPRRNLFAYRYTKVLREHIYDLDALLIRGPSPLLPAMTNAAGAVPVSLLLVGDYLAGIDDLPQPYWRKKAIQLWCYWNDWQQRRVVKRSLTFVNSHKLYEQLERDVPNLIETRTTTLSTYDFYSRKDTCEGKPIRLLYTGRIDRAKGLFEMVEAIELLVLQGLDVVLDLVGWPAEGDTILDELVLEARNRGVEQRLVYHGYKPLGPALFSYYKQADIYVIASRSSEGFPRTIWEAMAHSLPVIATKVGAIPHYLTNAESALVIEPRSSTALAEAVVQLISDSNLRREIIEKAYTIAQANTLEKLAHCLITEVSDWIRHSER